MSPVVASVWLAFQLAASPVNQPRDLRVIAEIAAGLEAKKEGRFDDAISALRKAVEMEPGLWAAHASLGEVYYKKHDYGNAIPSLRRTLELKADQPGVEGMLGVSLLAQGYAQEALPHLERGQVLDALGAALLEAGHPREAVERLEAARAKHPNDPDIVFYLAQAYGRLYKQALAQIVEEFPDSLRARQIQAEAYAAAGRADAAEQEYREVLRRRPDFPGVHLALGELYRTAAELEKAAAEFRLETEVSPGSADAALRLGSALLNLGRSEEALRALSQADHLRPDKPQILYEMAKARSLLGDAKGAEKVWLRAIEIEPKGALARQSHHQLSQLYRRLGNDVEADRHLKMFQTSQAR